jgi:hypothetical protein
LTRVIHGERADDTQSDTLYSIQERR